MNPNNNIYFPPPILQPQYQHPQQQQLFTSPQNVQQQQQFSQIFNSNDNNIFSTMPTLTPIVSPTALVAPVNFIPTSNFVVAAAAADITSPSSFRSNHNSFGGNNNCSSSPFSPSFQPNNSSPQHLLQFSISPSIPQPNSVILNGQQYLEFPSQIPGEQSQYIPLQLFLQPQNFITASSPSSSSPGLYQSNIVGVNTVPAFIAAPPSTISGVAHRQQERNLLRSSSSSMSSTIDGSPSMTSPPTKTRRTSENFAVTSTPKTQSSIHRYFSPANKSKDDLDDGSDIEVAYSKIENYGPMLNEEVEFLETKPCIKGRNKAKPRKSTSNTASSSRSTEPEVITLSPDKPPPLTPVTNNKSSPAVQPPPVKTNKPSPSVQRPSTSMRVSLPSKVAVQKPSPASSKKNESPEVSAASTPLTPKASAQKRLSSPAYADVTARISMPPLMPGTKNGPSNVPSSPLASNASVQKPSPSSKKTSSNASTRKSTPVKENESAEVSAASTPLTPKASAQKARRSTASTDVTARRSMPSLMRETKNGSSNVSSSATPLASNASLQKPSPSSSISSKESKRKSILPPENNGSSKVPSATPLTFSPSQKKRISGLPLDKRTSPATTSKKPPTSNSSASAPRRQSTTPDSSNQSSSSDNQPDLSMLLRQRLQTNSVLNSRSSPLFDQKVVAEIVREIVPVILEVIPNALVNGIGSAFHECGSFYNFAMDEESNEIKYVWMFFALSVLIGDKENNVLEKPEEDLLEEWMHDIDEKLLEADIIQYSDIRLQRDAFKLLFEHKRVNAKITVLFCAPNACKRSQLIRMYTRFCQHMIPMAYLYNNLIVLTPSLHSFTNTPLCFLIIYFLQQSGRIQVLHQSSAASEVEDFNLFVPHDIRTDKYPEVLNPEYANDSVAYLCYQFAKFYSTFDFDQFIIDIAQKARRIWSPKEPKKPVGMRCCFSNRNLASQISDACLINFVQKMKEIVAAFEGGTEAEVFPSDLEEFLKTPIPKPQK